MALVPIGGQLAKPGGVGGGGGGGGASGPVDPTTPGFGYAFIEFANIEGASKAKKALHGRRFGANNVEAEFFSEDKYYAKDFLRPTPNIDEPKREPGMELALIGGVGDALDEAPVMVE
ncbi:U2AF65B [Symbiodinium natans]|uniref:U2AF65B protein n=1 Tax=Symbiodinium natans TaxID=878477 RepID=A0A812MDS4_9DINO|nr:U2AF65B [Symbiodinium natans]